MIHGVAARPLRVIADERGFVLHMLKSSDAHFESFGEIYFSLVYKDVIKAWHIHRQMTLNYAVPTGAIKMVLFDDRPESPTRGEVNEFFPGERNHQLITVPPNVWNGFKGLSTYPALVANCATIPHDPQEIDRLSPFDTSIPYDWATRHG